MGKPKESSVSLKQRKTRANVNNEHSDTDSEINIEQNCAVPT